jgi:hypothetical protein
LNLGGTFEHKMLLLLKLIVVPGLVAGVTVAGRRWGNRIGGLLTALPLVAGPTLCFYAFEQGPQFAARAAQGTLLGLVAVTAFAFVYAWSCLRTTWSVSLLLAWSAFAGATTLLYHVSIGLVLSVTLVAVASLSAYRLLPRIQLAPKATAAWTWDLPFRMLAAAVLVWVLTSVAERLGPVVSGLLTPFPVATAIIAAFTHENEGPAAAIEFFRGFLLAENSFALFCVVLARTLSSSSLAAAVSAALISQLALQAIILWRMRWLGGVTDELSDKRRRS